MQYMLFAMNLSHAAFLAALASSSAVPMAIPVAQMDFVPLHMI